VQEYVQMNTAVSQATPVQTCTVMTSSSSTLGTDLTEGRVYHLVSDQDNSTCAGIWHPFYVVSIIVPWNLNSDDFRIMSPDSDQQVVYKGEHLYYAEDASTGDVKGQRITDRYET
jgi:hypothetical protein